MLDIEGPAGDEQRAGAVGTAEVLHVRPGDLHRPGRDGAAVEDVMRRRSRDEHLSGDRVDTAVLREGAVGDGERGCEKAGGAVEQNAADKSAAGGAADGDAAGRT